MNRRWAVAAVGLVFLATSCSKGGGTANGGLAEVAPTFEQEVQAVSDDALRYNSVSDTKLEVSNDGKSDVLCESGQVKRVYDASFAMLDGLEMSDILFGMRVNTLAKDYTVTKAPEKGAKSPSAELKRKDSPYMLALKIDRSVQFKSRMIVHAETECLDPA
jgi:hypothetical protein